jgi:hypothetical protein
MSEGVESLHAEEVRIVEDILVCCSVVAGDFLSDSAVDAFAEVVDMAALDAIELGSWLTWLIMRRMLRLL